MSDPAQRFAERFACGCSVEQGQWFPCPWHRREHDVQAAFEALPDADPPSPGKPS